jgi:hypothetical protein
LRAGGAATNVPRPGRGTTSPSALSVGDRALHGHRRGAVLAHQLAHGGQARPLGQGGGELAQGGGDLVGGHGALL